MPDKLTGSCQCKAVQYEISPAVKLLGNCHCKLCKKLTGAALSTIAIVAEEDFDLLTGADQLASFQVTENVGKNFCRTCGTPIFNTHKKYPGNKMVYLGSFDDPGFSSPAINVHCEKKLPWVFSMESLKNFDQDFS